MNSGNLWWPILRCTMNRTDTLVANVFDVRFQLCLYG
uniref:Uncharacterized protein n=1 Tax=Arundo donax TaxID=35708 RepID=A0A0A9GYM2_ARUDO